MDFSFFAPSFLLLTLRSCSFVPPLFLFVLRCCRFFFFPSFSSGRSRPSIFPNVVAAIGTEHFRIFRGNPMIAAVFFAISVFPVSAAVAALPLFTRRLPVHVQLPTVALQTPEFHPRSKSAFLSSLSHAQHTPSPPRKQHCFDCNPRSGGGGSAERTNARIVVWTRRAARGRRFRHFAEPDIAWKPRHRATHTQPFFSPVRSLNSAAFGGLGYMCGGGGGGGCFSLLRRRRGCRAPNSSIDVPRRCNRLRRPKDHVLSSLSPCQLL